MLKNITMRAGSAQGQPPLQIELSALTVFVGPNNSGKSRTLVEVEHWARSSKRLTGQLVAAVEFVPWTRDGIEAAVAELEVTPLPNETHRADHVYLSKLNPQSNSAQRVQIPKAILLSEAQNPNAGRTTYGTFLSMFTLKLDGTNRLALVQEQEAGDLQKSAPNHLAHLFVDNGARSRLRRIVHEAFGKFLVVDPTNIGKLRLRLSSRAPVDEREEKGWDSVAQAFHGAALSITEASDGVKAFVGMLATIIAGDPKITLLDEPEAFLHPALASRLGKELTLALGTTDKRLLIATHSAAFLMGCVQAGAAVNIVRLSYDNEKSTARLLKREKLTPLMRNPLLRSVGVLNALFFNAVVVTESDADRAFYQEINERLLADSDPRGIVGCLFLNAQNKQTVWEIVRPLRELGIPAVGVVDIDVLKDGGSVWAKPLEGAFLPHLSHPSLHAERQAVLKAFEQTGADMKRQGGIALLRGQEREACQNLFDKLSEYGVFVVPSGEVESWLSPGSGPPSKSTWLVSIFERMGDDPAAVTYTRPAQGDVWDFIGGIKRWVGNSARKGVPDEV